MFARTIRPVACVAVLLALTGSLLAAPAGQVDSRVKDAVKSLTYEYEVTDSGAVMVLVPLGEGRARPVFIESETSRIDGTEMRNLVSIARIYDGSIPSEAAALVKETNKRTASGRFVIVDGRDGKTLVVFISRVAANAAPEELDEAIKAVSRTTTKLSVALGKLS